MKLIDANELKKAIKNSPLIDFTDDDIFELIDNAPTVKRPSLILKDISDEDIENFKLIWQRATSKGILLEPERPHGKWLYPYYDTIIGKKRVGKSIKQCSICDAYFCNNIPWDAKYCPMCGSYNEESNGNTVDNI